MMRRQEKGSEHFKNDKNQVLIISKCSEPSLRKNRVHFLPLTFQNDKNPSYHFENDKKDPRHDKKGSYHFRIPPKPVCITIVSNASLESPICQKVIKDAKR